MCWTRETGVIPGALAGMLVGMKAPGARDHRLGDLHRHPDDHPDPGHHHQVAGRQARPAASRAALTPHPGDRTPRRAQGPALRAEWAAAGHRARRRATATPARPSRAALAVRRRAARRSDRRHATLESIIPRPAPLETAGDSGASIRRQRAPPPRLHTLAALRERLRAAGARPGHEAAILRAWTHALPLDSRPAASRVSSCRCRCAPTLPALAGELAALARVHAEHPAATARRGCWSNWPTARPSRACCCRADGLCVSTQVGCAVGCVFCMTGRDGLLRQLGSAEIVAQVALARARRAVRKVVFMGMGEPAHNLDNVLEAIELARHRGRDRPQEPRLLDRRRPPRVRAPAARARCKPALALSLHSTFADRRAELLPRAPRIDPAELVELGERYARATGYPIQYQWTLLDGVNDGDDELERIVALLAGQVRGDEPDPVQRGRRACRSGARRWSGRRRWRAPCAGAASSPSCASRPGRTSTAAAASCAPARSRPRSPARGSPGERTAAGRSTPGGRRAARRRQLCRGGRRPGEGAAARLQRHRYPRPAAVAGHVLEHRGLVDLRGDVPVGLFRPPAGARCQHRGRRARGLRGRQDVDRPAAAGDPVHRRPGLRRPAAGARRC